MQLTPNYVATLRQRSPAAGPPGGSAPRCRPAATAAAASPRSSASAASRRDLLAAETELPQHRHRHVPRRRVILGVPEHCTDPAKIIVWPPLSSRCNSRASGMPSKMAAAAAGMHQSYHDLTYYAKKCICGRRSQARRRRTGNRRAEHQASRDPAGPDRSLVSLRTMTDYAKNHAQLPLVRNTLAGDLGPANPRPFLSKHTFRQDPLTNSIDRHRAIGHPPPHPAKTSATEDSSRQVITHPARNISFHRTLELPVRCVV